MQGSSWEERIKVAIVVLFAAAVTALLDKEAPFGRLLKNFLAGILGGAVAAIIVFDTSLSTAVKYAVVASVAAFISTLWPEFAKRVKKKVDDVV